MDSISWFKHLRPPKHKQNWVLVILGLSLIMDNIFFGMIAPVIPLYAARLGASGTELGFLMASYSLTILVFSIPAGVLSDRLGRRPMILTSLLGSATASFMYASASNLTFLIIGRCTQGLFTSFIYSSCFAYIADVYPPDQRGEKTGLLGGLIGFGMILGPVIGGLLAETCNVELPFIVFGCLSLASFFPAYFLLEESRRKSLRGKTPKISSVLSNFHLMTVAAIITLVTTLWGSLEVIFPLHVSESHGGGMSYLGIIFGAASAVFSLSRYLSGRLSDSMGRRPLFLLGVALLPIAAASLIVCQGLTTLGLAVILVFLGFGVFYGVAIPYLLDIITASDIPGDPYGTGSSLYNFSWSLSFIIGAIGGGTLLKCIGFNHFHLIYIAVAVLCFVWGWLFCPRLEGLPRSAAESDRKGSRPSNAGPEI